MSYGSARPQRSVSRRRCAAIQSGAAAKSRSAMLAASALSRRGTVSAVTRAAVIGGLPSRSASTTGAAQHMPLQPAATTVQARPRRWTSTRSASSVSPAPTARPHVPTPTASREPVRRRSASRRSTVKRAPGEPAVTGVAGGPPRPVSGAGTTWAAGVSSNASRAASLTRPR